MEGVECMMFRGMWNGRQNKRGCLKGRREEKKVRVGILEWNVLQDDRNLKHGRKTHTAQVRTAH